MFKRYENPEKNNVKKRITQGIVCLCLCVTIVALGVKVNIRDVIKNNYIAINGTEEVLAQDSIGTDLNPENLIRFHVVANSDSEQDQALKYAVRDEILKKAAPILAKSNSIDESRQILLNMEEELTATALSVVRDWNQDYPVTFDYGMHTFPAKSYGNVTFPGGEYEAVKIKIGAAQGENWWCVLFPPICFVNVEESTTIPVDGKPGVPLGSTTQPKENTADDKTQNTKNNGRELSYKGKKVGFYFERFF